MTSHCTECWQVLRNGMHQYLCQSDPRQEPRPGPGDVSTHPALDSFNRTASEIGRQANSPAMELMRVVIDGLIEELDVERDQLSRMRVVCSASENKAAYEAALLALDRVVRAVRRIGSDLP